MNELSWYISVSHCVSDLKVFQNHFLTRRITGNAQEFGGWGSCVCSFHKNKWFSARRLLISHEHEKNLSVNNTEWLKVERTLLVRCFDRLGASSTRRSTVAPKHFRDQRGHETYCRLTEKEGLIRITFYTRLTFFFLSDPWCRVYNAVGAYDVHKLHCINLREAHNIVNALASV